MNQSHFTTSHVNKYLHLFRQLKDICFYFSTAGCLFSLLFFSFVQLYDPIMTHCVSFVSHSPAYVAPGPGPAESGGFYRLNPSSLNRFGDVWGWDILYVDLASLFTGLGQSVVVVPTPLRVVQSGHTVDYYSETLFNPETVIIFLIYFPQATISAYLG